jgi:hypothetical protein
MRETKGQLRVWHIPQVPMIAFRVNVKNIEEAKKVLEVLATYDLFQLKHKIKPDYSNAAGLEIFDGKEWLEWEDKDGNDIDNTEEE